MKPTHKIALTAAFLVLLAPARGFSAEPLVALDEEFQYHWRLSNFVGSIAALFLPGHGDGSLTFKTSNGHLRSELMITSTESEQGEYFRYGSEIDRQSLQPIRAWSAYSWRGESKSKTEEVSRNGALDIAAGIFAIRSDPPVKTRKMEIWSDGRTYTVLVIPRGREARKLPAGIIETRHFAIRGMDVPGRDRWKGKMDLWLATNAAATPVEIVISRNLADVRLELKSLPRTSP